MKAKHGVTSDVADEALNDPNRVVLDPDPASEKGISVRIIGWSDIAREVVTVIVLDDDGHEYGVSGWPANGRDQRLYQGVNE